MQPPYIVTLISIKVLVQTSDQAIIVVIETDDDGDGGDDLRRPDYARSIVILHQERNPWRQQE